jgi:hypothetical protein
MVIQHLDAETALDQARPGDTGVPRAAASIATSLQRTGEIWTIAHGAARVNVKDSRGMRLLARLVERPGVDVHVLALASDGGASVPESTAGEVLDERARTAYRRRIAEIADQLDDAVRACDALRAANLEHERTALRAELARATGLTGRARQAGSATERARINVQKRIKDAIARIAAVNPSLGRFLGRVVRTGTYCCFRP